MPKMIGPDGLFEGQPEDAPYKPRTHGRRLVQIAVGLNFIAIAGLFVACEYGDRQAKKTLNEQAREYAHPGAIQTTKPTGSPTFSETATASASASVALASPTTIPKVPFASSTISPSKAPSATSQSTAATRRPTTNTTSKAPERNSPSPKLCRIPPVSLGVAAVTNACGGNMLGYDKDGSNPIALTPGMQGDFTCVPGEKRVQFEIANAEFWVDDRSLGNVC